MYGYIYIYICRTHTHTHIYMYVYKCIDRADQWGCASSFTILKYGVSVPQRCV